MRCAVSGEGLPLILRSDPSPVNGFEMFNYMALMVCARGRKDTKWEGDQDAGR